MDAADYRRFFEILTVSRGLITGSVVLAVLLPNEARSWTPHNLNIVLPADSAVEMVAFLGHIGYMQAHSFSARADAFKRIYCYVANDGWKPIFLAESKDSYALSAVLASSSSGLMNVLNGTTCVSFYPKLTLAGICRGGDVQCTHEVIQFEEQGLQFRRHSGGGLALCGYSCAKLWRPVRGLRGIGTFQWGATEQPEMQGDTYWTAPLKWRLGGKCDNIFCANMEC